jgi:hypothetical protein
MTAWSYIWIGALLKIPAVGFVWLVWRALRGSEERQTEPAGEDGSGGSKLRLDPHPRPRAPRRGATAGAEPDPQRERSRLQGRALSAWQT